MALCYPPPRSPGSGIFDRVFLGAEFSLAGVAGSGFFFFEVAVSESSLAKEAVDRPRSGIPPPGDSLFGNSPSPGSGIPS